MPPTPSGPNMPSVPKCHSTPTISRISMMTQKMRPRVMLASYLLSRRQRHGASERAGERAIDRAGVRRQRAATVGRCNWRRRAATRHRTELGHRRSGRLAVVEDVAHAKETLDASHVRLVEHLVDRHLLKDVSVLGDDLV